MRFADNLDTSKTKRFIWIARFGNALSHPKRKQQ
jgi:hypothetical protein